MPLTGEVSSSFQAISSARNSASIHASASAQTAFVASAIYIIYFKKDRPTHSRSCTSSVTTLSSSSEWGLTATRDSEAARERALPTVGADFFCCFMPGLLLLRAPTTISGATFFEADLLAGGVENAFIGPAGNGRAAGEERGDSEGALLRRGGLPITMVTSRISGFAEALGEVSICTRSRR